MSSRAARRTAAAARSALGGTGALLALLVLAGVFVAVAGPREGLGLRTRALQQTLAGTSAVEDSLQVSGNPVRVAVLRADQVHAMTRQFTRALAGQGLTLLSRAPAWGGITAPSGQLSGASPSATYAGAAPQLELIYRDALSRYSRLAAGREPARSAVTSAGGHVTSGTFDVAVTPPTAARFGLQPGTRLVLAGPSQQITLAVTGIIRSRAARSAFWTQDLIAAAPYFTKTVKGGYWSGSAFVAAAEVPDLERVFGTENVQLTWDFPLALGGVNADQGESLVDHLSVVSNSISAAGDNNLTASSGLFSTLSAFLATQSALSTVLFLLIVSLVVMGGVAVLLGARMVAEHRDAEFALIRARGASLGQIAAHALRGGALATLPAAAAGALLAIAVTPGDPESLPWRLAAAVILVALAGPPLIAVRRRATGLGWRRARRPRPPRRGPDRTATLRRLVADGSVIIACAGGLAVLHSQGLPRAGINLYASAAPVLIAAPVALLVMRLYPLALRWLLRMTARRRGMTVFVGLARAARGTAAAALPAFALVLALAVVAFGAMMREAIARGQVATSWQVTGADAMIGIGTSPIPVTPPLQHAVGAVPGVRRTAAVFVTSAAAPSGTDIDTAAVDPGRFAALTAQTPYPAFPAALLAKPASAGPGSASTGSDGTGSDGSGTRGTVPVLASRAAAGIIGRRVTTLRTDNGALRVRVAGILPATAALPGDSTFIVVPAWAMARLPGPAPPNLLLVSGPRLDQPGLAAVVHRMFPGGTVAFRAAALASLARAPLPRSAYLGFVAGTGAAAGFSVTVLLLALMLGARSRELTLARLSTMGMGPGQGRRLAVMEAAPSVLAALVGGTACAWGLAALIGPAINLSPFTGSGAAVGIRADPAALAGSAAGLAALALVTLIIQTAVASRRGPARALRAGG